MRSTARHPARLLTAAPTQFPPPGNRTATGTLSPKQHTSESVVAYLSREQSDNYTLRPSCREVCPRTTLFWGHTHPTQGSTTATHKSAIKNIRPPSPPSHIYRRDTSAQKAQLPRERTITCTNSQKEESLTSCPIDLPGGAAF
ncbi:hypothetical protein TcCL_ESM08842 [Trypanosoma cruzi]|nr:hypothetical protein TcCL_ESM08842 [Trypanosoma cruzi]